MTGQASRGVGEDEFLEPLPVEQRRRHHDEPVNADLGVAAHDPGVEKHRWVTLISRGPSSEDLS